MLDTEARKSIQRLTEEARVFLVLGPPGTGKSTFVQRQIHAAVSRGLQPLVASLTKAAAEELAGRDLPIDQRRIGTLHAHAYRALGGGIEIAESKASEWNAWLDEQIEQGRREASEAFRLTAARSKSLDDPLEMDGDADDRLSIGPGDSYLEALGTMRAMFRSPTDEMDIIISGVSSPSVQPTLLVRFARLWSEWKGETGYLDFTDLIERCLVDGFEPPIYFDALFLDEAQDMSRLEMALALQWAAGCSTVVVCGDADQNLYEWRGSEPSVFADIYAAASDRRVLSRSFRVPRAVHAEALRWIRQIDDRIDVEYEPTDAEGEVQPIGGDWKHPDRIVAEIERELERDGDVMVIASCGYLLGPLLGRLKDRGLPFSNRYAPRRGQWNPLAPTRGTSAVDRLLAFSRVSEAAWGADARFWTTDEIKMWADPLQSSVFERGAKASIKRAEAISPRDLGQLVHPDERDWVISGDVERYATEVLAKSRGRYGYLTSIVRRCGVQALRSQPRITVGTIHSVKGGEAGTVILLPDLSRAGAEEYRGDRRARVARQFYVGLTRARQRLLLPRPADAWAKVPL